MKKMIFLLILFFFPLYVYADSNSTIYCDLDELIGAGKNINGEKCGVVTIKSTSNLKEFSKEKTKLEKVVLKDAYYYDLSFLKNSDVEYLEITDSIVDFDSFVGDIELLSIVRSSVVDDDFSGLKNNKNKNFSLVKFYESFVKDFSSFPIDLVTEQFTLARNFVPLVDLSFLSDFKGNSLNLSGMTHNLTQDLINSFRNKSIAVEPSLTNAVSSMNSFEASFDSIVFGNDNIFAPSDYERITIEVTSYLRGPSTNVVLDTFDSYFNGVGDSFVYATLTTSYYIKRGYDAYTIVGYHDEFDSVGTEHYLTAFIDRDGKWKYSDNYVLELSGMNSIVMGLGGPYYYMSEEEYDYKEYVFEKDIKDYVNYEKFIILELFENNYSFIEHNEEEISRSGLPVPTANGYEFMGWYKEKEYINPVVSYSDIGSNKKIYAKWTANTVTPEEEGSGTVPNPETGFFVSLFIVLPLLMLFGLEYLKNKNNKIFYKV